MDEKQEFAALLRRLSEYAQQGASELNAKAARKDLAELIGFTQLWAEAIKDRACSTAARKLREVVTALLVGV